MEKFAYEYAVSKGYIKENPENKVMHISQIFDLVAGTSTGGIIAAALTVPSNEDMDQSFDAASITQKFIESSPVVFKVQTINTGLIWIITCVSMLIGGVLGYKQGRKKYSNPAVIKTINRLKDYIKELK